MASNEWYDDCNCGRPHDHHCTRECKHGELDEQTLALLKKTGIDPKDLGEPVFVTWDELDKGVTLVLSDEGIQKKED